MTKWFKNRKRTSENRDAHLYENLTCKNCGTKFSGKFCPECGQSVKDYDKPISFFFYNFTGDFFAFDTRFFTTLADLLIKPGFLTKEFFEGRRVRFAPPLRIFVFSSFILFLLLNIYINRGLREAIDQSEFFTDIKIDSLKTELKLNSDSIENENVNIKLNLETFGNADTLRKGLIFVSKYLEDQLLAEKDPENREKLKNLITVTKSPNQTMAKILQYMSWAFFILLPIFALILKLFYIRRNHNYLRHLVFSIHIHSFIFIVFILIVLLYLLIHMNIEIVTTILFLTIPVYIYIALKNFYGQHWGKVLLKFFGISVIYNIIFLLVIGLVIFNAIGII